MNASSLNRYDKASNAELRTISAEGTIRRWKQIALCITGIFLLLSTHVASAATYNIMPVGDSITAGYTDNPAWNVPFNFGYRAVLYEKLNMAGISVNYVGSSAEPQSGIFGTPTVVPPPNLASIGQDHHEGYGGVRTNYINANIEGYLTAQNPDVVLLMIGINDIPRGSSATPTAAMINLNSIVRTVVNAKPEAKLIVAQTIPYTTATPALNEYNDYIENRLVPAYAAGGKFVTTVDQYSNFIDPASGAADPSLYSNGINHPSPAGYAKMAQTWFDGIGAIDLDAKAADAQAAAVAANLVRNGNFDSPAFAADSHNVNPAGAQWVFSTGQPATGSGIDLGNPYGAEAANSSPADGDQMAFLQSSGGGSVTTLSQEISGLTIGRQYRLTFQAKGMSGMGGANPFWVKVSDLAGAMTLFHGDSIAPPTGYLPYAEVFTATSDTMTLSFYDGGLATPDKVSWIDSVAVITLVPEPPSWICALVALGAFAMIGGRKRVEICDLRFEILSMRRRAPGASSLSSRFSSTDAV